MASHWKHALPNWWRSIYRKEVMLTNRVRQGLTLLVLFLVASVAHAQTQFPLGSNGWMGLGNRNGDLFIEQDDLSVKVPGGYVRINRDYDGRQWVFNRQWSGLGHPSYNKAMYPSMGAFFSCTIMDGVSNCDTTASAGTSASLIAPDNDIQQTRIPNDPHFGRDAEGRPLADPYVAEFVARKGVGFTRSSDGTSWVSSKHPRYVVRPQSVPTLPTSGGPDAHPAAGKPGAAGLSTTLVNGFRWVDRSGSWIEYDNVGRITSYGDRNNVRVWLQYGAHGQVERVLDDNGRTVFTLLYSNGSANFITEVRDHTPVDGSIRRIQYQYDNDGRLRRVIDARNNATSFDYGSVGSTAHDYNGTLGTSSGSSSGGSASLLLVDTSKKITKVTDGEGRVTVVGYGVTARMGSIKAPDGGTTEFDYGYDKLKKEFSVTARLPKTDGGQRIETLRFDQEGRAVQREVNGKATMTASGGGRTITYADERGGSTTIARDNFDEVSKITYADGASTSYTYEAGSTDVREYVDEAGVVWRNRWDGYGNLLDARAAVGKPEEQVTEYVYNARGEAELIRRKGGPNPDGSTDPDVEIRLTRDANGNVSEVLDGEGKRWKYTNDSQGNVTEVTDPLGRKWTYRYDANGNQVSETDPNQNTTSYTYDRTDRPLTVTDGRGKTSRYGYDAAGRSATTSDPYGNTFTDQYDLAGHVSSRADASGQKSRLSYDSLGRLTRVMDGENYQTLLEYTEGDGVDRGSRQPGKITYPTFERLLRYDARKRPVLQTDLLAGDALTQGATFDSRNLLKTLTDPNGHTKSFEHDALGRTVAAINELGETVRLGYDHRDQLVSVTDEKGHVTRMVYDRRGLLASETNAIGQSTLYGYDDAGSLVEVSRPTGARVVNEYDPAGRIRQSQSFDVGGAAEETKTYQWDAADNLTGWTTGRASAELTYDDADRLLGEAVTIDGVRLSRAYTYYPNDQVKTYAGPDGVQLTYSYDQNGQLTRIEIPGEGAISATDWNWMAARKVVFPGGTVQEIERDGLMQLTRLRVKSPSQVTLFDLENRFDKMRELKSRDASGKATQFEYDEAVRLVKADAQYAGGQNEIFVIDKAGNREQHSLASGTWEYDDANRLQRRGEVSYDYDSAGNLIRKVDARLAEPLRTTRYTYDGFNRLVEVRDGAGEDIASYAYDPFDNRLVKEVFVARNGAEIGKTLYLHGEEGLLAEVAGDGGIQRSYGWHPDGAYATNPLFVRAAGEYLYYHNDHLGTPWRVTNKSGAVVWSANDYSAFGAASIAVGAQLTQPWRFPGQYLDVETGLHYNLRRYYEPETGRYTSEDPLGFDSATNFYSYADHSPTNNIDPTGEWFFIPALVNGARAAATWAGRRYLSCLATDCSLSLLSDLVYNPCNIDISDCLKECLWSLLPINVPCGKAFGRAVGLGQWAMGVYSSFTGDTEVATPEGRKRIDNLRPGDKVLAYAEWSDATQVEEVTDLIMSQREQTIVTITFASGEEIQVTGGHPLHTPTGWRAAQLLEAGGQLDIKGPDGKLAAVTIKQVERRQETIPVYNLEVSNAHTFFVGDDGVLAHNAACGKRKYKPSQHRDAWEKKHGKKWPQTDEGKNYHAHHEPPLSEGGKDVLGEVHPMHPRAHAERHKEDFRRWGAQGGKK